MDAEDIIHNWSDFSSGESEFSEESNQWNVRQVTLIGFDKYASDFSALMVLKVYTYRPCVLGTLLLSLKQTTKIFIFLR